MPARPEANPNPRAPLSRLATQASSAARGRIGGARVIVALVHAGARLHVGRRRIDRRHDRAGRGVGLLPGMNRARRESLLCRGGGFGGCIVHGRLLLRCVKQIITGDETEETAVLHDDRNVIMVEHRQQFGEARAGVRVSSRCVIAVATLSRNRSGCL